MENRTESSEEEWIQLKQYEIPNGQYIVTNFIQDLEGTKIILISDSNVVEVFFDGIPVLVRNTIEGIRMRTWGEVQLKYKNKKFFRYYFLFQIKNSKLIDWAVDESCNFYDKEQLNHYCIVTSEELIDILASFTPTIKVYNKEG